jgi:hypothetical protein
VLRRNQFLYALYLGAGLSGLLLLTFRTVTTDHQTIPAIHDTAEPTVVWPPPTIDPTLRAEVGEKSFANSAGRLESSGLDIFCTPICWKGMEPGITKMHDIFAWFDTVFPSSVPLSEGNIKQDKKASENMLGVGAGIISLFVFSDATEPEPLLRAYKIEFPYSAQRTSMDQESGSWYWLPQEVIARQGAPGIISLGAYSESSTFLLLDYEDWAIQYILGSPRLEQPSGRCKIFRIGVWTYSSIEADGLSLLQSLSEYEHAVTYAHVHLPKAGALTNITGATGISRFVEVFEDTGCIPESS